MSLPVCLVRIHYRGNTLSLLDTDDLIPLYTVKVTSRLSQMSIFPPNNPSPTPLATASFNLLSTEAILSLSNQSIPLRREKTFTRTYTFTSLSSEEVLFWRADGALTGDFKLVDKKERVVARFHNKVFSTTEVWTFELVGELSEGKIQEVVMSGLGMLVMVQSGTLALMVVAGA
jgi:hypothetical protein